jgi:excinuclease ABC subunit C
MNTLDKKISNLPKLPGVYQFINNEGKIIYVGKAKELRNRVSSYFNKNKYESLKTKILSKQVVDIKHIIVESESDAFLLENNLIKRYQPKYNILLKDDKTFPWICIKNELFPRVITTRKLIKDGSLYYGPYTSVLVAKTLLLLVRQLYQLRTCKYNLTQENIRKGKFRKCLEFHIDNCKAPCEGFQIENDYDSTILQIKKIFNGNIQEVIVHLNFLMNEFAMCCKFEEAEVIKQKILLLEKYKSKSTIVNPKLNNIDVFSFIEKDKSAFVNFIKVINGAVVQSHTVELVKRLDEKPDELLLFAIINIKQKIISTAIELVVPFLPAEELPAIKYTIPKFGDKKKLLELSERNAKQALIEKQNKIEIKPFELKIKVLLAKVKSDLQLKEIPKHIECFDNSNIQGANPVAACIVFKNGKPVKGEYRHYNIKTVIGPDDFASMEEIVFRRYKRIIDERKELPQLVIIDGGKGQLNAALNSLKELNINRKIAIIGIAKRLEEIYYPNDKVPLYLDKKSPTLKLIQNLRNEAHRFGISFHRNKRSSDMIKSKLEGIKGIGEKSIEKLLKIFGSVESIKHKGLKEIEHAVGKKLAKRVYEHFNKYS